MGQKFIEVIEVDLDYCVNVYSFAAPVHSWDMEGDATDTKGVSNGSEVGSVTYSEGVYGEGADCTQSDYIDTGFAPTLGQLQAGFTLLGYMRRFNAPSAAYIGNEDASFSFSAGFVGVNVAGQNNNVALPNQPDSAGELSIFRFCVLTYDGVTVKAFFDGNKIIEQPLTASALASASNLRIGSNPTGATGSNGRYDRVQWYDFAWTDSQVAQAMTQGVGLGCNAQLGVTGVRKCKNTNPSCQDLDSYDAQPKTYRYYTDFTPVPLELDGFGVLENVDIAPAEIVSGKALGRREDVVADLVDFSHHDRGIDKYAQQRSTGEASSDPTDTYTPAQQGTHFGKLRANNLYYNNRPLRYYHGSIPWVDELPADKQPAWSKDQFYAGLVERHYVLDKLIGPDNSGRFQFKARDILNVLQEKGAQAPLLSTGVLDADIDDTQTVFNLKAGNGAEYPASGVATIGRETFDYTLSGDQVTIINGRGNYGTDAESHSEDDTFQIAYVATSLRIDALCADLIANYTAALPEWLDTDQWSNEAALYLPRLYSGIVTKPTQVEQILDELSDQVGFNLYPDTKSNLMKLLAIKAPSSSSEVIEDGTWIVNGSVKVTDDTKRRVSQVWTSFGIINPQEKLKDQNNYQRTLKTTDANAESADQYGSRETLEIYSRWISRTNLSAAEDINERKLSRFRDYLRNVEFLVWATRESQLAVGATRLLRTREIQDFYGAPATLAVRLLGIESRGDYLFVKAEEQRYTPPPAAALDRTFSIATTETNVNLRELHDAEYAAPTGVEEIRLNITFDAIIGSTSNTEFAFDTGDWPPGQPISIYLYSAPVVGRGGQGDVPAGGAGFMDGGPSCKIRVPVQFYLGGTIGGGGGGGGSGRFYFNNGFFTEVTYYGGGGGAGYTPGEGGLSYANNFTRTPEFDGQPGTVYSGGVGYDNGSNAAGDGGGLGAAGQDGSDNATAIPDPPGGAAGLAIEGYSNITWIEENGDLTNGGLGDIPSADGEILGATSG